jgi:hypothetical protein
MSPKTVSVRGSFHLFIRGNFVLLDCQPVIGDACNLFSARLLV